MTSAELLRVGRRVAATGATAARAAVRLGPLGAASARARLLGEVAREVLGHHGLAVVTDRPPRGPALLVSNHVSWLDPLVVASAVDCVPVSKSDVAGWPLVGRFASAFGVLFVDRGDVGGGIRVLRQAARALAGGLCVLNFPEGTTTAGDRVLPFSRGLFGLAARAGVPVVPVALAYAPRDLAWTGQATFLPHYLRLAAGGAARARVRFGAPLPPGRPAAVLAGDAREAVAALLGARHAAAAGA